MAQYHNSKAITGNYPIPKQMYDHIKESILEASSIELVVSFVMESGVRLLLKSLKEAIRNGCKIKLLTGRYLNITQPSALYILKRELGDKIEIYFYNETEQSFHPKAYFFHYDEYDEVYVGSSNISYSALTSGIEWNYRFTNFDDEDNYQRFIEEYENLKNNSILVDDSILKEYSKNWKQSALERDINKLKKEPIENTTKLEPNGVQTEALYELEKTRKEGSNKALICAATGIGKTYLAAFDSLPYKKVLFVAHRVEILKQAYKSFKRVRNTENMGFFNGNAKETEYDVIFASVATLGKKDYLNENYFSKTYFDYIVVDEFHHAVNTQYMNIINYFKPKFLLGLTATPERMDGRSIFSICDYNVPYEITLKSAINKGILSPFRFYGIYDQGTDYSQLKFANGRYREEDLDRLYQDNETRASLILKHYLKYPNKRALGFCASTKHAAYMANYFMQHGIKATAVYSNSEEEFGINRQEAIDKLANHELDILFCVDMFNEGLDVPSVDLVLFLRPTESATVFIQQLGRGLRKEENKEYLTVLDFIGNSHNVNMIPHILSNSYNTITYQDISTLVYPDQCIVDFDLSVIDIFKEMSKTSFGTKDIIKNEFIRIQELLGHLPSRVELFNYMDDEIYKLAVKNVKLNIFKNYYTFLKEIGLYSFKFDQTTLDFLKLITTTNMSKSYKMPVLKSFYQNEEFVFEVTDEMLLKSWKEFYSKTNNYLDLNGVKSYEDYLKISDKEHLKKIHKMPISFLIKSGKNLLVVGENGPLRINTDITITEEFIEQYIDIIEYRSLNYYKTRYENKLN